MKKELRGVRIDDYTLEDSLSVLELKRKALLQAGKDLLNSAANESRDLTDDEKVDYDDILRRVELIALELDRRRSFNTGKRVGPLARLEQPGGDYYFDGDLREGSACPEIRQALTVARQPEYRKAFWNVIRAGGYPDPEDLRQLTRPETRALTVGADTAGGFLCPTDFERRIVEKLAEVNPMRTLATVLQLASDRQIPVEASTGAAAWISEGAAYPESDPSFGQMRLSAFKLGNISKVSEELLQDSGIDLEAYLAGLFGRTLGIAEETAFVNGDGVGKPHGILLGAQTGVTAGSAAIISADELVALYHSLSAPYRARATWLMNDATIMTTRLLKDGNGQYLWQTGLQAGQPDRLLGRPVIPSAAMPVIAAKAKSVLFGDLSYYWIADRIGRVLQILREAYATTGHVGFRIMQRVDGVLTLPEAAKVLVHP